MRCTSSFKAYHGLIALVINLIVVIAGSLILNALRAPKGKDVTRPEDFEEVTGPPLPPVEVGEPQPV